MLIEAITVCVLLNWETKPYGHTCETWYYDAPMERTVENLEALSVHCKHVVDTMRKSDFEVTCEEYVEEMLDEQDELAAPDQFEGSGDDLRLL